MISPEDSLEIWRRMCLARFFDECVFRASKAKLLKGPVYLGVGQESIAAAVSVGMPGPRIFAQHRAHAAYLCFGGDPLKLIDELLGLPDGCCGGMGGSACIHDPKIRMVGHDGLIGSQVPMAIGAALGDPASNVVCFFGDGAAEEDYVLGSLGFAAMHKLPVLFVCEDNDLSVLTRKAARRHWTLCEVARAFGIQSADILDDPWTILANMRSMKLPALLNVRTCRKYWHVGAGQDGAMEWNRFAIVKAAVGPEAEAIETETKERIESLWSQRLPIPSAS